MEGNASIASSSNPSNITSTSNSISSNGNGGIIVRQKSGWMRIENPFTFKVLQIFTGFGIGCGIGIGVGRPLQLGAIPGVNQVMSAAGGATHAFSGVQRHVNTTLKKLGARNIEAGIGCGVGFGRGFGVGIALKPGVVNKIQLQIMEAMTKLMMKFGAGNSLPVGQGFLPSSLQSGMPVVQGFPQDPLRGIAQFGKLSPDTMNQEQAGVRKVDSGIGSLMSESEPASLSSGTRSEKLINSFLQDPVLRGDDTELHGKFLQDGQLRLENKVLRLVIKHQQVIEELMEENERLRQILVEDLKVPPSKLRVSSSGRFQSPCYDCPECRRKARRR